MPDATSYPKVAQLKDVAAFRAADGVGDWTCR